MNKIIMPFQDVDVIGEFDVCVVGGSCTGVFAAVTAARQGYSVCIVEKQNCFGGVSTNGLVHIWHSLFDTIYERVIIGGLTKEMLDQLKKRNSLIENPDNSVVANIFNTEELKIELDLLITQNKVTPFLHTSFYNAITEEESVTAVVVGDKNGLHAIKARFFIDATGDGDLCRKAGIGNYIEDFFQPPSMCAKIFGIEYGDNTLVNLIKEYGSEFGLEKDWGWRNRIPNIDSVLMHAETHVFDVNCADALDLTKSEIEGRRQVRAVMDLLRKYHENGEKLTLLSLPSYIGVRETYHIEALHKITADEVLYGKRFDDAIANGSYRVDYHHAGAPGITFKYLDGTQKVITETGGKTETSRWREEIADDPTFYQIPYRSLVPKSNYSNILYAGRMIDSEREAYSALRVMVNTNQMGEAAGMAATISLKNNCSAKDVSAKELRSKLVDAGSVII